MLQRVMLDGIELPRLYIAETMKDAELAKSKGIPFIRWTRGQDELIRMLLRPVLESMFPHIKWSAVLGPKRRFKTIVEVYDNGVSGSCIDDIESLDGNEGTGYKWTPDDSDAEPVEAEHGIVNDDDIVLTESASISAGERLFHDTTQHTMTPVQKLDIEDYIGDMSSYVNLEILQRLRLMPAFIGDILDCVKLNIGSGMYWSEGYNKRRGLPVGRYDSSRQLPNLVILDISGSIPRGISATMISLIDTLRTQLSADLIITSTNSRFYPMGTELPDPQTIRNQFGYGNESYDFMGILTTHIRGRHYGHVFSFGDNDTPNYTYFNCNDYSLAGTRVEYVHHYHTGKWLEFNNQFGSGKKTGYAKWCHLLSNQPIEEYDTSWCEVIS